MAGQFSEISVTELTKFPLLLIIPAFLLGWTFSVVMGDLATRAFQVTPTNVECCRGESLAKARRVNAMKFLTELKRRNVYRAAVAYGVVASTILAKKNKTPISLWTSRMKGTKRGTGAAYLA